MIRSGRLSGTCTGDRRAPPAAPREVEVWRSEHRNSTIISNQRLIDCVNVSSPMHNPKPRKSDVVKSRLRFVLFGFLPGFGSISSILIEVGNHAGRSASSVRLSTLFVPSGRQQAPRPATMGKGKGTRASICLPQPAHAPLPTRPEIAARARASCFPRLRAREYPAWRQPAMQTMPEESA